MAQQTNDTTPQNVFHRRRLMYAMVLMMIALVFFLGIHLFSKVREIQILGNSSTYTDKDLIQSSGITIGKRLYGVDEEKAAAKILETHPLLERVRIDKTGFFGIVITVQEKQPMYYCEYNDSYYVLSADLCVLKQVSTKDALPTSLVYLSLPEITQPVIGSRLTLVSENLDYIMRFNAALQDTSFFSAITTIQVTDKYNLKAFYNQNLEIRFGNYNDLAEKCKKIEEMLQTLTPELYVEFDVRNPDHPRSREKTS